MSKALCSILLLVLLPAASVFAQGDPRVLTYSYSNLFDGELRKQTGFTSFEMVQSIEEAFTLWSEFVPLSFVEQPDSGPPPSDEQYLAEGHPGIRIGHHAVDDKPTTLAHAFFPGNGGLAGDLHFDSSDRTWSERLFLTTAVHELGHSIGIDHIDDETAIMNSSIGGANMLAGVGRGFLFPPDIAAAQVIWGVGSGTVTTQRTWTGAESAVWSTHANWEEGFRPTQNAEVLIQSDSTVQIDSDQTARAVTMGGGSNSLRVATRGSLTVRDDVALGTRDGGNRILAEGAIARTQVPQDGSIQDDWFGPDFDDSQWTAGSTGIGFERSTGFEDLIQTDIEAEMYNRNASVYSRVEFDVADPSQWDFLTLRMRYDDGFVAYLNGVEVAAANRPINLNWNSRSEGLHDDDEAIRYVDFGIDPGLSILNEGRNVLAIQGLNYRVSSSDMLISPEIAAGALDQELIIDGGSMTVGGDLALAQNAESLSRVSVNSGSLTVRGDVTVGDGQAAIDLHGGVLRVEGDSTPTMAIAAGATAHAFVPTDDRLGTEWTSNGFDDSTWKSGPTGIGFERNEGFGDLIATDLEDELYAQNSSFYTRIEFDTVDVSDVREMNLAMRFDDGFVAYLNGTEIARANAPDGLDWNSTASDGVDDNEARVPVDFDISQHVDLLTNGTNVLAVHGLNQSPTSTDVLLIPELSFRNIAGTLNVGQLNFFGGQLRDLVRVNAQFNHQRGSFSPSLPGSDGAAPGSVEINGAYTMQAEAVLELNLDGTAAGQHDALRLLSGGLLDGTLSVVVNANGGDYTDPAEPGEVHQIDLLIGEDIEGQFQTLLYDGQSLEGHQGDGLFRQIIYGDEGLSLLNYRAFAGDATGDGRFDTSDFIVVFQAGKYEDSILGDTEWTEGDWNGDQDFSSDDLILALQTGRYEQDAIFAIAIPEPSGLTLLAIALLLIGRPRRGTM